MRSKPEETQQKRIMFHHTQEMKESILSSAKRNYMKAKNSGDLPGIRRSTTSPVTSSSQNQTHRVLHLQQSKSHSRKDQGA